MIRLIRNDPESTVNLLQQNHAHQLVGEGHFGEAQAVVRAGQDPVGQP